jgi:prepilin-type N-terminal cleavage/methylation domain-containing protein
MSKKSCSGFSLLELMVVLMLVGLLAGLSFGHASIMNHILVRYEVERLYATALYLQRLAMATGQRQRLTLQPATHSYIYNGTSYLLPQDVRFGIIPGVRGSPGSASKLLREPITFVGSAITFEPTGIIQPGSVYLINKEKTALYALTCSVSQVSFLRKYRYANTWKVVP